MPGGETEPPVPKGTPTSGHRCLWADSRHLQEDSRSWKEGSQLFPKWYRLLILHLKILELSLFLS